MPIPNRTPLTFRPTGVCDAIDGSNAGPGSMAVLTNLVPNPRTRSQFVPRPAAVQTSNFAGFNTPAGGEALVVIGHRAYGMIASSRFPGKSEPFCYDLVLGAFVAISGATAANCPTSLATTGDITPPTMAMIADRVVITHPGYDGVTTFVGWIDTRSFTSIGITGSTHSNTTVDTLSSNPITSGWQVGDTITGAGIPAGTTITALTAASVTLSQAATATAAGVALTVTSGTMAAPTYGAGQTNGNKLIAVPKSVANFNGRAYYATKNSVQLSDALLPLQITNASQALVLGDDQDVTALKNLPLSNMITGGVLASLIAFKHGDLYYQITGDPATNNLAANAVDGSVGTEAPNTVVATPKGLAYIAPDGLRIIGLDAKCSDPIGNNGSGVNVPFQEAVSASRMCAAYESSVYRVAVQNGAANGQPVEDYWYDMNLGVWTGPHTFPPSLVASYHSDTTDFVMFANGVPGKLWSAKVMPDAVATYTENGAAMSWVWRTSLLPDNEAGAANQVIETALGLTMPTTQAITVTAFDETGATLAYVPLSGTGDPGTIWNSFTWGGAPWGGAIAAYRQYAVNWPNPVVFKQASVQVNGQSASGFVIGNLYAPYQVLGYMGAFQA